MNGRAFHHHHNKVKASHQMTQIPNIIRHTLGIRFSLESKSAFNISNTVRDLTENIHIEMNLRA